MSVQRIAADTGMRPSFSVPGNTLPANQLDVANVSIIRWCIEQYYHVELHSTECPLERIAKPNKVPDRRVFDFDHGRLGTRFALLARASRVWTSRGPFGHSSSSRGDTEPVVQLFITAV